VPVRAGVLRVQTWLDEVADSIKQLESQPGRLHMSVAESSFTAWVKLYRRDEHTRNCTISYYLKGELVCLLLDQAIRERSGGAKSLDDVMRHLYALTAPPKPGYPEERLTALFEEASGVDVADLFAPFVDGTDELPMDRALAWYGLEVQRKQKGTGDDDIQSSEVGWLGVDVANRDGRTVVTSVTEGAPAWTHGLYFDDEVIALDSYRVDAGSLGERMKVRRPGDKVVLTVARRERLREVELVLGERPRDDVKVVPKADATDEQKARFQAWVGQPFPEKKGGGAA
jgi:predicted metalloprotease with PDZ domain